MNTYLKYSVMAVLFLFTAGFICEVSFAADPEKEEQTVEQSAPEETDEEDLEEEEHFSQVGENLLNNSTFEESKKEQPTAPDEWERTAVNNRGTVTISKQPSKDEKPAVQVWSSSDANKANFVALTQEVPVEPDTPYTLSSFMKSNLPADAKAYLNTEQLDVEKNPLTTRRRWRSNRNHALTGRVDEWTERKLDLRTGGNTSFVRVYLEVEQDKKGSQGSAWFRDLSFTKRNETKTEAVFNGKGSAENLLTNSRFERHSKKYTTFPDGWERLESGDKGRIRLDPRVKMSGAQSIQLCPASTTNKFGHLSLTQVVPVDKEETYTLSGYIRTHLPKDTFAFLNVEQLDAAKRAVPVKKRWKDNRYSKLTGTQDWTKRQVTFKASPLTSFVRVYLEVDHTTQQTDGSAWFDHIQLERGSVSSSYNLVENGSFEREESTESGLEKWYASSGDSAIDPEEGASGGQSIQFHRPKKTDRLKQVSQVIPINQSVPAPITISAMVQGQDLENAVEQAPNVWMGIVYDGIAQDGDYHIPNGVAKAPLDEYSWRKITSTLYPTKPIKQVNLYACLGGNNTGTIWFDDLRVQQGNAVTTYEYDTNTTKIVEPMGNTYQATRDGKTLRCTDGKGNTMTYTYDEYDQLIGVEAPGANIKVHYTYDDWGNITKKKTTSKDGKVVYNQTSYEYDEEGRVQKIVDPLNHVTQYTYEENERGNKTKIQYADKTTTQYTYDSFGRTTEETFSGKLRYKHTYVGENEVHIKDTVTGKTKKITFDKENRVQKVQLDGKEIRWQYSGEGNLQKQTIQDKNTSYTHQYEYNDEDQNTVILHPDGGEFHFDYDEEGRVIIIGAPNQTSGSYDYDDNGRITKVNLLKHDGSTILRVVYTYDANNNRTSVTDHKGKTIQYTYDEQDQLTSETDPLTGNTLHYTYDAVGNRIRKVITGPGKKHIYTVNYVYNKANQLVKVQEKPFTYDIHGNLKEDSDKKYIWDDAGRLSQIQKKETGKTIATFLYDEEGRRVRSVIYGKTTNYIYDGDSIDVLYETNEKNEVTCYYTRSANGQLLSMKKASGEIYYYHYNAHEDVIAVTDQKHQNVATYVYDAWGNILDQQGPFASENPYRYAGYRYDEDTRLYYLTARYYNPRTGTFLSLDPAPSELEDIHTQNGYCYVGNNPVMQADPSGEVFWFAVNAAFAAYDGYQAYKAGKGWGEIALSTAVGFVGGGRIKGASKLVKGVSKFFKGSKGKKVLPRSVKKTAPKPKGHGKAKPPVKKYAVSKKKIISGKTKGHVKKAPVKKTTGGGSKGKGSGSSSSKGKGPGSNSSSKGKGIGTKKQKKVEKGNASNPEKKHNVVVRSTQRHLSEGERQALQSFLFKARKQNSLRSVKLKSRNGKSRSVEDLIKESRPGNPTKGRATQYELRGGYEKAVKDFKSLKPTITRDTPELKIGTLKDGRTVNVRIESTDKRPTLEIQKGKRKVKFRYSE